jgi:pimeloyl-ACP methyl ester carboxylesterase
MQSGAGRRIGRGIVRVLVAIVAVLAVATAGFLVYANIVARGDRAAAIEAWDDPAVHITDTGDAFLMEPTGGSAAVGLVFLPGAKVSPAAYLWKLSALAEAGITVVITKPTLNFALFDQRPLDAFTSLDPDIATWFVGGHSLGGVRACQLAPDADGLVLFGSYCANDLSDSRLPVLSIGGSDDGLSTPEKIAANAHLLPETAELVEIDGLNHAGFGDYGVQEGDGVATLTRQEAREALAAVLVPFLLAPQGD